MVRSVKDSRFCPGFILHNRIFSERSYLLVGIWPIVGVHANRFGLTSNNITDQMKMMSLMEEFVSCFSSVIIWETFQTNPDELCLTSLTICRQLHSEILTDLQ